MAISSNADVAGKVRGIAAERRIQQSELAKVLHVSKMAMSRRFTGQTAFTPEELIRLATHLGVPVAAFFGETADQERAA